MPKERLDKIISSQSMMTRSEASRLIKGSRVTIDAVTVTDPSLKINPEASVITVDSKRIDYKKHIYIMLNKPDGVVSASRDPKEKTVVDLVPSELQRPGLFPAGRLDKDTTGFVLITDDGDFAHSILSPKNHISKTYIATTEYKISDEYLCKMSDGITIGDETFMPAKVTLIADNPISYEIVICEGKYHQIKRMIGATGAVLTSLKRIKMGEMSLDASLSDGACRELDSHEVSLINSKKM